jgi:hypothetical protein
VAEWRVDPANAASGLGEVPPRECAALEKLEQVGVDGRSCGLHQIECERVAAAVVDMDDAEARVETHSEASEPGLGFEDRVEVVEDCVCRVDRETRAASEAGAALPEREPVLRYCSRIICREAQLYLCPCGPVDDGRVAFRPQELVERRCVGECRCGSSKSTGGLRFCREELEHLGLAVELCLEKRAGNFGAGLMYPNFGGQGAWATIVQVEEPATTPSGV